VLMIILLGKFMKEFNLNTRFCKIALCVYCIGLLLSIFQIIYFLPRRWNVWDILFDFFILLISVMVLKYVFPEIIFILRFYGVKLKQSSSALIFYTNTEEYKIEMTKEVYSMWCMMGYLIIWPSEKGRNIILLRESLIKVGNFSEFESYLKSTTNYLSLAKEKKEILKLFNINILNPLKYIKLPRTTK